MPRAGEGLLLLTGQGPLLGEGVRAPRCLHYGQTSGYLLRRHSTSPRTQHPIFPDPVEESQLSLGWRTGCLGVCGDKDDIHSTVLGLIYPMDAAGDFSLLLTQQF